MASYVKYYKNTSNVLCVYVIVITILYTKNNYALYLIALESNILVCSNMLYSLYIQLNKSSWPIPDDQYAEHSLIFKAADLQIIL